MRRFFFSFPRHHHDVIRFPSSAAPLMLCHLANFRVFFLFPRREIGATVLAKSVERVTRDAEFQFKTKKMVCSEGRNVTTLLRAFTAGTSWRDSTRHLQRDLGVRGGDDGLGRAPAKKGLELLEPADGCKIEVWTLAVVHIIQNRNSVVKSKNKLKYYTSLSIVLLFIVEAMFCNIMFLLARTP